MNTTAMRRECLAGYDEGLLKALLDGQLSTTWRDTVREHAAGCSACSERLARLRLDGALVHGRLQLLSGAPAPGVAYVEEYPALSPRPPVGVVLAQAKQREDWRDKTTSAAWRWMRPAWPRSFPLAASAAAATVVISLAFTSGGQAVAQSVFQSLRVQRVQPVAVDLSALRVLPAGDAHDLSRFGTYTGPKEPQVRAASLAEAARSTGLNLRAPSNLPASLRNSRAIYVSERADFAVTYDGQKVVQAAREMGIDDSALLTQLRTLDGVTVRGSVPAAAAFLYGTPPSDKGAGQAGNQGKAAGSTGGQFVGFLQVQSPTLSVPQSVNVDQLRELVLKSGAVPPALANQLLAIQDWRNTLPIPVTRGKATQVSVDGTTGTLVTGELAVPALIWQKDGVLYVLAGTLSETELLDAARSLQPAK
jgi:hypothetical protein